MKKILFIVVLLLGVEATTHGQSQELFVSATNTAVDGYVTVGGLYNNWGLYLGVPFYEKQLINQQTGSLSSKMKFGVMRMLKPNKLIGGLGIQPVDNENKINAFIGYNPLKSTDMKLWIIGNITNDTFTPGLGLSYRLK